jgi:hypothetical protein
MHQFSRQRHWSHLYQDSPTPVLDDMLGVGTGGMCMLSLPYAAVVRNQWSNSSKITISAMKCAITVEFLR